MEVAALADWTLEAILDLHRAILRIRLFEEAVSALYRDGEIPGFVHLSIGQEAVAVGVCSQLRPSDGIVTTHRGHGHCLAKGAGMSAMFAELMGRESGTCHGRGGSMHVADLAAGVYGANGIVGAGLPIAAGIATAFELLGRDDVVVAFFGEGAVATGAFHEAVNLASVWRLPILFLCENNHFAEFSRLEAQQRVTPSKRAGAYGLDGSIVDGNDVIAVADAVGGLVEGIRGGGGPHLLEAVTYRWHGHYEGDPERYRTPDEVAEWKERDPVTISASRVSSHGGAKDLSPLESAVRAEVDEALAIARSAPAADASPGSISRYTTAAAAEVREAPVEPGIDSFRYMDAVREALTAELTTDPTVWVAGIDVAAGGGVFGITRDLAESFPGRVRDTPISETAVIGLAVGGAMAGTKPVVELMYLDFLGVCLDQLLNQAAKLHFMTGGAAPMSLVVRTQFGAGRSSGPQHSQSLESILTQIPGLKVVMPSTPSDAYGLLRASIHDPNPVVFIENRLLYGLKGPKPPADYLVPLGRAKTVRAGDRLTVVSWSRIVHDVVAAAELAAESGVEADVIDLRTVAPIDRLAIAESVKRTHRLLIVHEAALGTGIGADLGAWAADELFWDLDVPVRRIAPPFSPVPYARELEAAWLPSVHEIRGAIELMARA
jgi:2-oxoisovalerate dehydrogenase E1 component